MKYLIDTQAIIWFAENNPQLSQTARKLMEDSSNQCFVSLASFWEISIKMRLGKLDIKGLHLPGFWDEVTDNDFITLEIRREHILENGGLPLFHRDPFDRLLISQAVVEAMPIISSDSAFDAYPVTRIW